jgi:arginine repressor
VEITKKEQIVQRQAKVLELSAQGLTQHEIVREFSKMGINISQKTISNDLAFLRKDAIEFVKQNREHVAFEFKQTLSNFYQLRKEGGKMPLTDTNTYFSAPKRDTPEDDKIIIII